MKIEVIVICSLGLLVIVNSSALKCSKCHQNECECVRHILKASTVPPISFCKMQVCEESRPVEFQPIKDVCSCLDLAAVRPDRGQRSETPKFADSNSCECGYKDNKQQPKKYFADSVSQHLAAIAARKKQVSISETDLHFLGNAIKVTPNAKPAPNIMEERLHKFNRQVIELKPSKKNRVYHPISSEEDEYPCDPKQQSYSDICYDKVNDPNPVFEQIKPYNEPCEICQEAYTKEENHCNSEPAEEEEDNDYEEDNYDDDEEEDDEHQPETVTPETTIGSPSNTVKKRSINSSWQNPMANKMNEKKKPAMSS
ncbi:uncharacterized protein LOC131681445 [Topomyia yanbarensis]|uniref:uncharacterized protein LOC131681445 n=1 Tax=Topomyia yanbarensis TaxID=2498891 RepID=UPI00273BF9CB|nr:uncharacterized protein LOC131681445 [Topomyia yanbarensis]